jgi:uncharacterized membrane protein (DUF2068 family)
MSSLNPEATEEQAVAADQMSEQPAAGIEPDPKPKNPHARGLLLIGLYKLSKAIFFAALGFGALDLIHRNLGDLVLHLVDALRLDPMNKFVSMAMDRADLIGGHQLRQASMASFGYAVLCLIEGTGLVMRKVWAEYFTVFLTAGAMPWEGYELLERYTAFKLGLLLVNMAVLLYLLWVLKKKKLATA